jgi:hypothetical protein
MKSIDSGSHVRTHDAAFLVKGRVCANDEFRKFKARTDGSDGSDGKRQRN